jgi:protein-disulfide isomerase
MPKKAQSDVLEISVPKFTIPLVVILVLGLIAFFVFSNDNDEEVQEAQVAGEVDFSDAGIVEASVNVDFENSVYIGDPETADYAVVEFSDYKCPYCGMHGQQTFPEIREEYLDEGEVIYVYKEVAIMAEESMTLTVLGRCVFEHGGEDEYLSYRQKAYDASFETEAELLELMEIESSDVKDCFESGKYESVIENNSILSQQAGVQGVPGFVVGELGDDGLVQGYIIPGAYPFSMFQEVFNVLMN